VELHPGGSLEYFYFGMYKESGRKQISLVSGAQEVVYDQTDGMIPCISTKG